MARELLLAVYLIAVGLAMAGAGTYFYQLVFRTPAMLRYDGSTCLASMGHVFMSFICGPYIMLQLGWRSENGGTISASSALLSALVAFGWSFLTGMLFIAVLLAIST